MSVDYLCVVGDHFCSAAYAAVPYVMANQDPQLVYRGRNPHPENIKVSWQNTLARSLNMGLHTDAQAHRTPATIVEVAKKWIEERGSETKLFIAVWPQGWPVTGLENTEDKDLSNLCQLRNIAYYSFRVEDMLSTLSNEKFEPVKDNYYGTDAHSFWAKNTLHALLTKNLL